MSWNFLKRPKSALQSLILYGRIFGFPGLFRTLVLRASRQKTRMLVASHWSIHPIYLRLNSSDINVFRQVFIEREYQIIAKCAFDDCVVIDAGANIGLTSLFISSLFPNARIFAVEPEQNNFELLKINTMSYQNIHCIHGALWDKDEQVSILSEDDPDWAFRVGANTSNDRHGIPGYRVSSLLDQIKAPKASLLKMDIEGAEFEVLGDAGAWIDRVDNIVLELHDNIKPGCTDIFRKVTSSFVELATSRELTLVSRQESGAFPRASLGSFGSK